MFAHLDRLLEGSPDGALRSANINTFTFDDTPIRLIVQTGIWKPARLDGALTIRTTYTAPDEQPPYADDLGPDGLVRYKYRGMDADHADNRALRNAMTAGVPLAYFVGISKGVYVPRYPVWIVAEDRAEHDFTVAVDEGQRIIDLANLDAVERAYVARLTRSRLHQPVFRARVLRAYADLCAMCRLRHPELLDAAHILPDGHPHGDPVVPNGLSLCKIHHAAYDYDVLGVRPDLVIEVQPKVLAEIDGPMLRHGIQEMAGVRLTIPRERAARPDEERLAERYEEFKRAG
jgi:putative restriction endonuclease